MKKFILILLLLAWLPVLRAEDTLFIGNSFTYTNDIPLMYELLATSKGKSVHSEKRTKGGIGWGYHLFSRTELTDTILKSKPWNFVAIQDYSTNATHVNFRKDFFKNGELLYDKIAALSPTATIILYETWAFPSAIEGYVPPPDAKADEDEAADSGKKLPKPKEFKSEAEMFGEIHTNYKLLFEQLKAKDSKRSVLYAPVGSAFAACREAHPEIALCGEDGKHPSIAGSYLSACVFFAVIHNESPVGAAPPSGKKWTKDAAWALPLQEIAASVVLKK
jgi:hypothetical protein